MLAGGKALQLESREPGERRVPDRVRNFCADTHLSSFADDCRHLLPMRKHRVAARLPLYKEGHDAWTLRVERNILLTRTVGSPNKTYPSFTHTRRKHIFDGRTFTVAARVSDS
jgi:hypothetical protein